MRTINHALFVVPCFMLGIGAASATPIHITQTPESQGNTMRATGAMKVKDGKIVVTLAVPNEHAVKGKPFVWYPASKEAALGNGQWQGLTLGRGKKVGGQTIYEATFKEGEHNFGSAEAYRAGIAFGTLVSAPKAKPVAVWGQHIGANTTPQLAPTEADREFLKSMGLKPTF